MSKSKRGKKATRNTCIKQLQSVITSKFEKVNFDDRRKLFEDLEKWARETMGEQQLDLFLEALYSAPITQDIQITIALEKALERINPSGKDKD